MQQSGSIIIIKNVTRARSTTNIEMDDLTEFEVLLKTMSAQYSKFKKQKFKQKKKSATLLKSIERAYI